MLLNLAIDLTLNLSVRLYDSIIDRYNCLKKYFFFDLNFDPIEKIL